MNKEEIIKRALIILHTTGYTNELEKSLCIDAIEQLQQENKRLKDRIDKAIEYIDWQEKNPQYDNVWRDWECNSLIKILRGDN